MMYNFKLLGISGSLLKLIHNYLDNRFQRVLLLNGQTSEWKPIKAGVSQGSIKEPFLLLEIPYCFLVLSNFSWFLYFFLLSRIVRANKFMLIICSNLIETLINSMSFFYKASESPKRFKLIVFCKQYFACLGQKVTLESLQFGFLVFFHFLFWAIMKLFPESYIVLKEQKWSFNC